MWNKNTPGDASRGVRPFSHHESIPRDISGNPSSTENQISHFDIQLFADWHGNQTAKQNMENVVQCTTEK